MRRLPSILAHLRRLAWRERLVLAPLLLLLLLAGLLLLATGGLAELAPSVYAIF